MGLEPALLYTAGLEIALVSLYAQLAKKAPSFYRNVLAYGFFALAFVHASAAVNNLELLLGKEDVFRTTKGLNRRFVPL